MKRIFGHLVDVRPIEAERVVMSACFFFFILFGYSLLRPVREALGIENSEHVIKYLYVGTMVVTALANPLFGWGVSRFPRRIVVPWTYRFFMANIAVFGILMMVFPAVAKGQPVPQARTVLTWCYYIWVTVFALFNTMVFWAVMADTFRLEQSKRVYAPIAVGGTLGAIGGGASAKFLATQIGTPWLVLCSIVLLEVGVWFFGRVSRAAKRADERGDHRETRVETGPERSIGGDAWSGLLRTLRSPYLMGAGGYIVLMSIVSTFFYFAKIRVVDITAQSADHRTELFGQIDMWTQIATLVVQLFLTSQMVRRAGVGVTMAALPVISFLSFGATALDPAYAVMAIGQVAYGAGRYAFARPARETLFTVLDREDRYKSKAFVDTFLFRAGDVMGAMIDTQTKALSKSLASAAADATASALQTGAVVIGVIAVGWSALALWLGRAQGKRAAAMGGDVAGGPPGVATGAVSN